MSMKNYFSFVTENYVGSFARFHSIQDSQNAFTITYTHLHFLFNFEIFSKTVHSVRQNS